jgi:hypothetical protein
MAFDMFFLLVEVVELHEQRRWIVEAPVGDRPIPFAGSLVPGDKLQLLILIHFEISGSHECVVGLGALLGGRV